MFENISFWIVSASEEVKESVMWMDGSLNVGWER